MFPFFALSNNTIMNQAKKMFWVRVQYLFSFTEQIFVGMFLTQALAAEGAGLTKQTAGGLPSNTCLGKETTSVCIA